jgi:phosphatidylserine synthase
MSRPPHAPLYDIHVSHGLTYTSLACGLGAMAAGAGQNGHLAGACLALAALADTFDGRFARLFARTERQTATGGQIDSLVDACIFGMAPIAILWTQAPPATSAVSVLWWAAALIYLVAVVTRLGSFNVDADTRVFVGVPTPAIALVWSTTLLSTPAAPVVAVLFVVTAALMLAPIVIPRPRPPVLSVFAGWGVALIGVHLLGA